jgi:hypothetical protein
MPLTATILLIDGCGEALVFQPLISVSAKKTPGRVTARGVHEYIERGMLLFSWMASNLPFRPVGLQVDPIPARASGEHEPRV